jgi:hypothetical protein
LNTIEVGRVLNINGQLPISGNVLISGSDFIAINNTLGNGVIGVKNTGIVSINNLNNNGNVTISAGNGITIQTGPNNTITVTNTLANIFARPCVIRSTSSLVSIIYVSSAYQGTSWSPWGTNVKSFPECPTLFSNDEVELKEGIWALTLIAKTTGGLVTPPCSSCGMTLALVIEDTTTLEKINLQSFYPGLNAGFSTFGAFSDVYIVGQVTLDGYIAPPGTAYRFLVYFVTPGGEQIVWGFPMIQAQMVRIA